MNCLTKKPELAIFKPLAPQLCLVGGAVRDYLMGKPVDAIQDIDMVYIGEPEVLQSYFNQHNLIIEAYYPTYQSIQLTINGVHCQLSRARQDYASKHSRHSKVTWVDNFAIDALRRDFTMNALYMDIATGRITDPLTRGLNDLNNRDLLFIKPVEESLWEDYLRLYRYCRFVGTLGLNTQLEKVESVVKAAIPYHTIVHKKGVYIWKKELIKLLLAPNSLRLFQLLEHYHLLPLTNFATLASLQQALKATESNHPSTLAALKALVTNDPLYKSFSVLV